MYYKGSNSGEKIQEEKKINGSDQDIGQEETGLSNTIDKMNF